MANLKVWCFGDSEGIAEHLYLLSSPVGCEGGGQIQWDFAGMIGIWGEGSVE